MKSLKICNDLIINNKTESNLSQVIQINLIKISPSRQKRIPIEAQNVSRSIISYMLVKRPVWYQSRKKVGDILKYHEQSEKNLIQKRKEFDTKAEKKLIVVLVFFLFINL